MSIHEFVTHYHETVIAPSPSCPTMHHVTYQSPVPLDALAPANTRASGVPRASHAGDGGWPRRVGRPRPGQAPSQIFSHLRVINTVPYGYFDYIDLSPCER